MNDFLKGAATSRTAEPAPRVTIESLRKTRAALEDKGVHFPAPPPTWGQIRYIGDRAIRVISAAEIEEAYTSAFLVGQAFYLFEPDEAMRTSRTSPQTHQNAPGATNAQGDDTTHT